MKQVAKHLGIKTTRYHDAVATDSDGTFKRKTKPIDGFIKQRRDVVLETPTSTDIFKDVEDNSGRIVSQATGLVTAE